MRYLNTKQSREESRAYQFDYLVKNGYTREDYNNLVIFQKDLILKVFSGTAAHHILFTQYRSIERLEEARANIKTNHDSREQYKKDAKGKRKPSRQAQAAAAIREELKQFKGVKFAVTSESFSMGDSVHISWTDGPTSEAIDNITKKYQYGSFNGMEDIYEYTNSREDIAQSKYVSTHRNMSEETKSKIVAHLTEYYSDGYFAELREFEQSNLIYEEFSKTDLCEVIEQPQQIAPIEAKAGEVNLIEYSDKSFVAIGDTKPIKDKLKELGGKFNFRLSCGAGWVFPKTKLDKVTAMLQGKTEEPQETTLKDEINKTLDFFVESDIKACGEITESTKEAFKMQNRDLPRLTEYVQTFNNIEDITNAANSGQMISLCNLSNILNNGKQPQLF